MKTRFFSTFPPGESRAAFLSAYGVLTSLDSRQLGKFFHVLPEVAYTEGDDRDEAIDRLASDLGLDINQAERLVEWSEYVIRYRHYREFDADQPDQWAADIVSLLAEEGEGDAKAHPDRVYKIAAEIAAQIWRIATETKSQHLRQRAGRGVIPRFESIHTTAELRGVTEDTFVGWTRTTSDLTASDYTPVIVDLVGIASVSIRTDDEKQYNFQMTEQDLKTAIRWLSATLRELDALQECVALKKKPKNDR